MRPAAPRRPCGTLPTRSHPTDRTSASSCQPDGRIEHHVERGGCRRRDPRRRQQAHAVSREPLDTRRPPGGHQRLRVFHVRAREDVDTLIAADPIAQQTGSAERQRRPVPRCALVMLCDLGQRRPQAPGRVDGELGSVALAARPSVTPIASNAGVVRIKNPFRRWERTVAGRRSCMPRSPPGRAATRASR